MQDIGRAKTDFLFAVEEASKALGSNPTIAQIRKFTTVGRTASYLYVRHLVSWGHLDRTSLGERERTYFITQKGKDLLNERR